MMTLRYFNSKDMIQKIEDKEFYSDIFAEIESICEYHESFLNEDEIFEHFEVQFDDSYLEWEKIKYPESAAEKKINEFIIRIYKDYLTEYGQGEQ